MGGLSRENFNKVIKDALTNKKGLGLTIGEVRTGHVVTMWGAEFNDEGDVSYIYIADNNDRNQYGPYNVDASVCGSSMSSCPEVRQPRRTTAMTISVRRT